MNHDHLTYEELAMLIKKPGEKLETVKSRLRGFAYRGHPAYIGSGMWNKKKTMAWLHGEYRWPERKTVKSVTGNVVSIKDRKVEQFV